MVRVMESILILGIGNTLLRDEAVGVRVIERLQGRLPQSEQLQILDGGTLGFDLAVPIEQADVLVVVDAANLGAHPGIMRVFENEEMDDYFGRCASSVHELGVREVLDMVRLTNRLPQRRLLLGIQPEVVEWGEELSPKVAASVEPAAQLVKALLTQELKALDLPRCA